jgi:hypothetical protein
MNTKTNTVAVAAILAALAVPAIASAQAMFLPSSYAWNQTEAANVPADADASGEAVIRHREPHATRPYGQW